MKTMRGNARGSFFAAFTLVLFLAVASWSGTTEDHGTSTNVAVKAAQSLTAETVGDQKAAKALSAGADEVIKMADAGVSPEVIKTYVDTSPAVIQPTHEDVIAMKRHNVPDEVTSALLQRGAKSRKEATEAKRQALAQLETGRRMASGGLDPDSYEYFQYYYLQPRALASAYERLYRSHPYRFYGPLVPYGPPYYGPLR